VDTAETAVPRRAARSIVILLGDHIVDELLCVTRSVLLTLS
jgi:hypothetical protein